MFEKDKSIMDGKGEDNGSWITVNGTHIFIADNEDIGQVLEERFGKPSEENIVMLVPQEYKALCSALKTKYCNNIPKLGVHIDNDNYYVYNFNEDDDRITCSFRIEICDDKDIFRALEDRYGKKYNRR